MQFTDGAHRAFESLMRGRPGEDHYDSGVDGQYPECRTCRYHRPRRRDRACHYARCPYYTGLMTAGNKNTDGGETQSKKRT